MKVSFFSQTCSRSAFRARQLRFSFLSEISLAFSKRHNVFLVSRESVRSRAFKVYFRDIIDRTKKYNGFGTRYALRGRRYQSSLPEALSSLHKGAVAKDGGRRRGASLIPWLEIFRVALV